MLELEDKQIRVIKCGKRPLFVGEGIHASCYSFTPCAVADSLVEAVAEAAKNATSSDVVLLSPARSSLDQFQDHEKPR